MESVTRDVRPRAVLDEWLDRGMVTIDEGGRIRLEEAAFAPRAGDERQFYYFGRNLHDHVAAAVENISVSPPPFFERAVHYEGVSRAMAENMLALSRRIAVDALQSVNREAQGAVQDDPGGAWRWNFGIYLFSEDEFAAARRPGGRKRRDADVSAPNFISRRRFLLLASLLSGVQAFAAEKGVVRGDNGIGGTGYRPGDNGIGGTGFVGTIRKFGSVYVNGQRIAYPVDAAIEIDGSRVEARDMRLGQVARLVADERDGGWTTNRIVIVSEVIGPVAQIRGKTADVAGQRVQLPNVKIARALKLGDRIAVGGLRRPDQVIVASAVERREGGLDQIAGVLSRGAGGELSIGGQKLAGASDSLVGQRVVARGGLDNGVFVAVETKSDADIAIGGVKNVSIETWVTRRDAVLETASGVRVEDARGVVRKGSHLVVINGEIGTDGRLIARQVQIVGPGGGFDPHGGGAGGGGPAAVLAVAVTAAEVLAVAGQAGLDTPPAAVPMAARFPAGLADLAASAAVIRVGVEWVPPGGPAGSSGPPSGLGASPGGFGGGGGPGAIGGPGSFGGPGGIGGPPGGRMR